MTTINLNLLQHSWTADVLLNNGQQVTIWYTCWPSIRETVKEVVNVSSDYPKHTLWLYNPTTFKKLRND